MTETRSSAGGFDLEALRDALEEAVHAAGAAILDVATSGSMRVGMKWGESPVSEADYAADEVLHEQLIPLIHGAHWLSEESEQSGPLVRGEPTWVVDPLDGTREFLLGIPEFGVSAALFLGNRLALGAVGIPTDGIVLSGLLDDGRREARCGTETLADLVEGRQQAVGVVVDMIALPGVFGVAFVGGTGAQEEMGVAVRGLVAETLLEDVEELCAIQAASRRAIR